MLDPDLDQDNPVLRDERAVVDSMYGDDCQDIAPVKTTWGTEVEAGWWGVTLRAHDGRVSVQIRVKMGKKYPDQTPFLKLHRPVGLTADHVRRLLKELQDVCRRFAGREVVVELLVHAENWIMENHVPLPGSGGPQLTLMEEKALREEAERAAEEAQSRAEYEQSIAVAQEESRLLQKNIELSDSLNKQRKEKLLRQEMEKKRLQSLEQLDDGELASREITLDEAIRLDGWEDSWRTWSLFGGRKEMLWTTYTAEPIIRDGSIDPNFVKTSLPNLWAQVIDFSKPFFSTDQGRKKVDSLVTEIRRLQITKSEHVLRVYGVKRDRTPRGAERVIVFVERPVDGGILRSRLPSKGLHCPTAVSYFRQIMTGLSAVHRNNGTQRLFDSSYVVVDSSNPDEPAVKLMGTGYAKRIIDEHKSNPFLKTYREINPATWASPDERNHPQDYTAKRDIWNSGILFVELLLGSQANWIYGDLNSLRQNLPLPDSIYDLLDSMMHQQPKKRPSAEEILERLDKVETSLGNELNISDIHSHGTETSFHLSNPVSQPTPRLPHRSLSNGPQPGQNLSGLSRYKNDFEELEKLGQGGFGMVVKARNQYDQRMYAIKKIKLRDEDSRREKVDKEIEILSGFSHSHIVRYYNCWTEEPVKTIHEEIEELTETSTPTVDQLSDPFAPPDPKDPFAYRDSSKSLSFPPVRFSLATRRQDEDSSDESDDEESSGDDSGEETESERPVVKKDTVRKEQPVAKKPPDVPSSAITGTTDSDPAVYRTLYIAMDFVGNGTLRELIDGGIEEKESWRLFQEVLQALSYIHSQNVVHRDLKPSNILINHHRQAIVADFGLSTFSAAEGGDAEPTHAKKLDMNGTKTSNIGTAAYIAPEVMSGNSYDAKADLYSLGVIFFEMNHSPMMGHERVQIINKLRSPSIGFPPSWSTQRDKQHQLITWMLGHEPSSRPGADTVLASPFMPIELKTHAELTKSIANLTTDRHAKAYRQLVEAIFDPPQAGPINLVSERSANWTFDDDSDIRLDATEVWSAVIVQRLKDLCHRHGAQETYLPVLIPETKLLDPYAQYNCVRLLDSGGHLVQLVACDIIAMARSAPRRHLGRGKRFHLGMEYHPSAPRRQPSRATTLSFDIVSPLRSAAADVEMIEVVDKVIAEFRGGRESKTTGGYDFHINHETILGLVLGTLSQEFQAPVLQVLKSLGVSIGLDKAKEALRSLPDMPRKILRIVEACCVPGEFHEMRTKLDLLFTAYNPHIQRRLREALDEMEEIVKLLSHIQIGKRILFLPIMANNSEFFRNGFMFQCVQSVKKGPYDVLAFGGRCDALLEHFDIAQGAQATTYGVAMSISVDHLVKIVSKYESELSKELMSKDREEERSFGYWTPSRCDVYVAAGVQVDLTVRMKLIAELWRSGISADLQYDDNRTLEEVTTECDQQSTPFLLLPRVNKTDIKVRSILRRNEKEVSRSELCSYLRTAIAEQRRIDATYASHEGSISSSQAAALSIEARPDKEADIRLVLPPEPQPTKGGKYKPGQRKHRHTTKSVYVEKIFAFLQSARSALPVIAIDLPASILAQLAINTTWITDDEAWKQVLADPAIDDRKYAETIREAVRKIVKEESQHVIWLFGVREGKEGKGVLLQYK